MTCRIRLPRMRIYQLLPVLLPAVSMHVAVSLAGPIDVPLHLEPIRQEPFDWTVTDADATAIPGGFYLVYNLHGCAPIGASLAADGSPSAPVPVMFSERIYHCANSVAVDRMGDDALAAWSYWTGTEEHVFAVLHPPETWTHMPRPRIDLGIGRVPAVAGAGQFGLLAFARPNGLVASRVDPASWPSHSSPIPLFPGDMANFSQTGAAYAPEVGRAMFVWRYVGVPYAQIVDSQGNPVEDTILLAASAEAPSVSWNGNFFVVVWSTGGTSGSIVLVRITADGVLLDQSPILVASSPQHEPASASIEDQTLIAWVGDDSIPTYRVHAARVDPGGTVLDPGGFLVYEGDRTIAMARNQVVDVSAHSAGYHVTWIENHAKCGGVNMYDLQDVRGAVVSSGQPPVVGPSRILSGSAMQWGVTAAPVGNRFWTAWQGMTRTNPQLLAARRDATGLLLDSEGIVLGQGYSCLGTGHSASYFDPVAAGNVGAVLTAWRQTDYLYPFYDLVKVMYCVHNPAGLLAGCNEFVYDNIGSLSAHSPVVAARDTDFLLAFTSPAPDDSVVMSWAGIENAGGQIAGGDFDLGVGEAFEDAASDGDGFLVSWTENGNGRDSFVGRFDGAFNFIDPAGILLLGGPGDQPAARLASSGKQYLAVWMEPGAIRAARINPETGAILDPGGIIVALLPGTGLFDVDWDGEHYILAWTESVGAQVARLKRIAPDLTSPDPVPVELAQRPDALARCRVASHDGMSLIAFTRSQALSTGHGILYRNPAATAIALTPAPAYLDLGAIPNPFWNRTEILTGTAAGRPGVIRILDVSGRLVHEAREPHALGRTIPWDGRDATGRPLSAGMYFYEISTPHQTSTRGKLTKLR